jgi:hypothetical protein
MFSLTEAIFPSFSVEGGADLQLVEPALGRALLQLDPKCTSHANLLAEAELANFELGFD